MSCTSALQKPTYEKKIVLIAPFRALERINNGKKILSSHGTNFEGALLDHFQTPKQNANFIMR